MPVERRIGIDTYYMGGAKYKDSAETWKDNGRN